LSHNDDTGPVCVHEGSSAILESGNANSGNNEDELQKKTSSTLDTKVISHEENLVLSKIHRRSSSDVCSTSHDEDHAQCEVFRSLPLGLFKTDSSVGEKNDKHGTSEVVNSSSLAKSGDYKEVDGSGLSADKYSGSSLTTEEIDIPTNKSVPENNVRIIASKFSLPVSADEAYLPRDKIPVEPTAADKFSNDCIPQEVKCLPAESARQDAEVCLVPSIEGEVMTYKEPKVNNVQETEKLEQNDPIKKIVLLSNDDKDKSTQDGGNFPRDKDFPIPNSGPVEETRSHSNADKEESSEDGGNSPAKGFPIPDSGRHLEEQVHRSSTLSSQPNQKKIPIKIVVNCDGSCREKVWHCLECFAIQYVTYI